MIKVIFFDIDGTLVPMGKPHILDSTVNAFNALRSKGIHVVICTGRHITEISEGNDLSNYDFDGIIATTGQYCLDANKKPFYTKAMNEHQHAEIISLFEEKKYSVVLKTAIEEYLNVLTPICKETYDFFGMKYRPEKKYNGEDIYQALIFASEEERKKLEEEMTDLEFTSWFPTATDIIPRGGGKVSGIDAYLEKENIDISETMAFGDGENDIEMLQHVHIGIAMGNANESVKNVADYITEDSDKDGIYHALKHFDLI